MDFTAMIFIVIIVVFSAIIHEVMHGVAADWLGDHTARYAGRLTLNPLVHLDPIGSVALPLLLALSHSPIMFGWAKPVPYNPYNLRPGRFSEAIVAGAGPASNAAIAIIFGLIIRSGLTSSDIAANVLLPIVVINVVMALFNMIPVPPLDGSKVLSSVLPSELSRAYDRLRMVLERNSVIGMLIVVLGVYALGNAFSTVVYSVASAIAGL